jgi:hypothetical protein
MLFDEASSNKSGNNTFNKLKSLQIYAPDSVVGIATGYGLDD